MSQIHMYVYMGQFMSHITFFFFFLSLAPQPSLGLGLLHKILLNFLEASQQFSFLQGRVVSSTPNLYPGEPGLCIYIPQRQGGHPFQSPLTTRTGYSGTILIPRSPHGDHITLLPDKGGREVPETLNQLTARVDFIVIPVYNPSRLMIHEDLTVSDQSELFPYFHSSVWAVGCIQDEALESFQRTCTPT
jgi:hypothetical protein